MARRKSGYTTRLDVCRSVAKSFVEFGYPDVTADMVKTILDAWIEGKRGHDLPHGVIGLMAGRQFNEVEDARPGVLAHLENA